MQNVTSYLCSYYFQFVYGLIMKNASQGGDSIVNAAISPEMEDKGGVYIRNSRVRESSKFSRDEANQKILWDKTMEMLKIKEFGKH